MTMTLVTSYCSTDSTKRVEYDCYATPLRPRRKLTKYLTTAGRNLVKGIALRPPSLLLSPELTPKSSSSTSDEFTTATESVSTDDSKSTSFREDLNLALCDDDETTNSCSYDSSSSVQLDLSNTSQRSDCVYEQQLQKKKRVKFDKAVLCDVRVIEPLFDYSDDLWWTKTELKDLRTEQPGFRKITKSDKKRLLPFLEAYYTARNEVCNQISSSFQQNLSGEVMYELSLGFARGYNGLEKYIASDVGERRNEIHNHTMDVISYTYKCFGEQDKDEKVAAFAHKSSSSDRYWALVLGKASEVAVQSEYE